MAKTKLKVVTDVGTFTRTTARTYTHLVVARGLKPENIRAFAVAELAYSRKLEKEYQAVVDGGPCPEWQRPAYPGYLAELREQIATHDARLEKKLADNAAQKHTIVGWAGRLDLAEKLASRTAINYVDVRIYAVATGKRVR